MSTSLIPQRPMQAFLILLGLWLLIHVAGAYHLPLVFDETRRIYPAQTMRVSGDYLNTVFAGESYYKKPPLFTWMLALALQVGGATEGTLRLPSALALLPLLAYLCFARSGWLDFRQRFLTGLAITCSVAFYAQTRKCAIDGAFAAAAGLAALAWLDGYSLGRRGVTLWGLPALALAAALLLKGPVALLLFYLVVICCTVGASEARRVLFCRWHLFALVIVCAPALVWILCSRLSDGGTVPAVDPYLPVEKLGSGMLGTWGAEIWERLNGDREGVSKLSLRLWFQRSSGGLGGFLPVLLGLFALPWLQRRERLPGSVLIKGVWLACILFLVVVLALPLTKGRYILPAFPLVAALAVVAFTHPAAVLSEARRRTLARGCRAAALLLTLFFGLAAAAVVLLAWVKPGRVACYDGTDIAAGVALALVAAVVYRQLRPDPRPDNAVLGSAILYLLGLTLAAAAAFGEPYRAMREGSDRQRARELAGQFPAGAPLAVYGEGEAEPWFFYLKPDHPLLFVRPGLVDAAGVRHFYVRPQDRVELEKLESVPVQHLLIAEDDPKTDVREALLTQFQAEKQGSVTIHRTPFSLYRRVGAAPAGER